MRIFSLSDRIVDQLDQALRTLTLAAQDTYPKTAANAADLLSDDERRQAARLMRVNHAGEIAAQALYHGHALLATSAVVHGSMRAAARDEMAHLNWTTRRLHELKSHRSYLMPFWYAGSFTIGAMTALMGDRLSLGFVAETERQVVTHLQGHMERLPPTDHRSRAILEQMIVDEDRHATQAVIAGGAPLAWPVRWGMRLAAKVMTTTAYWL